MPILTDSEMRAFPVPPKSPGRLRIALSHEFVELYRGDKDLRIGRILAEKYNCEIVHLGTDIASPGDSRVFKTGEYPVDHVGQLPPDYHLLLMKSRLIIHRKGDIGNGGFFRVTLGIIPSLLKWKPDLIFENPYLTLSPRSFMTFIASRILRIPLVYIDCGDITYKNSWKNKVVYPFEKQAVNRIAAVITYNNAGQERFIRKYNYPCENIHVIPKPVDTKRFRPDVESHDFRRRYELNGKFVVAYFGRLCANKGARVLLEAADIMRQRRTDNNIVFLFVGGNLEAGHADLFNTRLEQLGLENVKVTGMFPNSRMPEACAAADIAVFPDVSNPPGFSTVLAESMAAGLPIIIGNKGWEQATPIENERNGLVIEPSNPAQLADGIERLKKDSNLKDKLSANVLKFARSEMDYEMVTRRYFEIFSQLTGKSLNSKMDVTDDCTEDKHKEFVIL